MDKEIIKQKLLVASVASPPSSLNVDEQNAWLNGLEFAIKRVADLLEVEI